MAERKWNLARPAAAALDLMVMGALAGAMTGFGSQAAAQSAAAIQVASGLRAAVEWGLPAQQQALGRILDSVKSSGQPSSTEAGPDPAGSAPAGANQKNSAQLSPVQDAARQHPIQPLQA